jgi:glycosyltransferase involved in cell wall biosynthesis
LYILWIGGIFDERTVLQSPALSPAANAWQKGFVGSLVKKGISVEVLGHLWAPLWPKGRLIIRQNSFGSFFPSHHIKYVNIPVLRNVSLYANYKSAIIRLIEDKGAPVLCVSYNLYPFSALLGHYIQRTLNIPFVPIVADGPLGDMFFSRMHDQLLNSYSGNVFLSWSYYSHFLERKPSLHLDGGVNSLIFESAGMTDECIKGKIILYAGSLGKHGGIDNLLQAFLRVKNPELRLWICGKGSNSNIDIAVRLDNRIKFWGLVGEDKLSELMREAWIFINPRSLAFEANSRNFPSKILTYLTYGKPIISIWSQGMSPEYRDALIIIENDSPIALQQVIEKVASWDASEYSAWCDKSKSLASSKLWSDQAQRFIDWAYSAVIANFNRSNA